MTRTLLRALEAIRRSMPETPVLQLADDAVQAAPDRHLLHHRPLGPTE